MFCCKSPTNGPPTWFDVNFVRVDAGFALFLRKVRAQKDASYGPNIDRQ